MSELGDAIENDVVMEEEEEHVLTALPRKQKFKKPTKILGENNYDSIPNPRKYFVCIPKCYCENCENSEKWMDNR